ncbi:phosphoribosylanthranilate isomerase [Erythrobacter arachoides]|uniref:N-(5'-phosphoribosyl)anthranilate isomerase n=1 Tax=Aurantiacibacter arachoides TaxID=1850444 RepID=A0A844ZZZ5_9SPHN|nr:phosphoribosylanthranilate isomerase [Aurantiacibacter arachoides]MXO92840.1 phosphoribosylanthranilate isomerase [Aurantiacibacter arachoides]GGD54066.1 N-(5'-phosphoribosyl)anthranilate isomerase [Aurantiacibacter arachoides]
MPETLIKICGLTTPETVDAAVEAGATHIGLVHFPDSPRHIAISDAAKLRQRLPRHVKAVLLTVNLDPKATALALQAIEPDVLQLHGSETVEWLKLIKDNSKLEVWKAVGLKDRGTLERAERFKDAAHRVIYDAPSHASAGALPGGNGLTLDWRLLMNYRHAMDWGLAGGLTPDNVADAIRYTGAPLVDASSGLESERGVKDIGRIKAFCQAAREAQPAQV